MKNLVIAFIATFVICSCASLGQQTYSSHKVQDGETISGIANKYNLTVYELYRLNPEARDGLYPGLVLVLPGNQKSTEQDMDTTAGANEGFKTHTVKKGETLYSLSKQYDVSEDVIKRFNTQLYSAELRMGDTIKIPLNGGKITTETQKSTKTNRKHVVKPKETIYGLASMYGITIAELQELNPGLLENLPIGTILNVPDKSYTSNAKADDEKFGFYEVRQGDTFYSLTRRWELTEKELIKLNPSLEDGLQNGMVLKLPKEMIPAGEDLATGGIQDLRQVITDFSKKNIAVLLPFNTNSPTDSLKGMLKRNGVSRIALDFYSGALAAVDTAKALGISTNLYVYDTQYMRGEDAANTRALNAIISASDFDEMDVVIGPLLGQNVKEVSDKLRNRGIPVVSPLTPKLEMTTNLFQARPNDNVLRDFMLDYIGISGVDKNIIVIADTKNQEIKRKILELHPNAKILDPRSGDSGYYLNATDISSKLDKNRENWVILETNDIPLLSNTITNANTLVANYKLNLMTTSKGDAYDSDDISNMSLMRLGFQFPSVDRQGNIDGSLDNFASAYKKKYGIDPNNYAIRGYDLTLDTLLRLATAEDLYASAKTGVQTQYIENKFNYIKASQDGFYNTGAYILKYGPNLSIEEIKVPKTVIEKVENFKD